MDKYYKLKQVYPGLPKDWGKGTVVRQSHGSKVAYPIGGQTYSFIEIKDDEVFKSYWVETNPKTKVFRFNVHRKGTVWICENYQIPAADEREAKSKIIEIVNSEDPYDLEKGFISDEFMQDTWEAMELYDNDNQTTVEIFTETMETIYENGKSED